MNKEQFIIKWTKDLDDNKKSEFITELYDIFMDEILNHGKLIFESFSKIEIKKK